MIGHKRIEGCEGGIEKTVRCLSEEFARQGHHVTVYDRRPPGTKASKGNFCVEAQTECVSGENLSASVDVVPVPTLRGSAEVPVYSFIASLRAAFSKCDIVMYHASGPCLMLPIAKLFGKKTVAFIHGLDSKSSKWGRFASFYLRGGERAAAKSSDSLLILSENIKSYFINTYRREGIIVANGIEQPGPSDNDGSILDSLGLKKDGYYLWVGRLSPEKRVEDLILAWRASGSEKKLVLCGNIDEKNAYYKALKACCMETEKSSAEVLFAGYRTSHELEALYRNCFAFILPSQQEGMPHVLLEAMSCGAYCILSDIPENRAVGREYSQYFAAGDEKKLAEIMSQAEAYPAVRSSAEGEKDYILENFGMKKCCSRIIDICQQLL